MYTNRQTERQVEKDIHEFTFKMLYAKIKSMFVNTCKITWFKSNSIWKLRLKSHILKEKDIVFQQ